MLYKLSGVSGLNAAIPKGGEYVPYGFGVVRKSNYDQSGMIYQSQNLCALPVSEVGFNIGFRIGWILRVGQLVLEIRISVLIGHNFQGRGLLGLHCSCSVDREGSIHTLGEIGELHHDTS